MPQTRWGVFLPLRLETEPISPEKLGDPLFYSSDWGEERKCSFQATSAAPIWICCVANGIVVHLLVRWEKI